MIPECPYCGRPGHCDVCPAKDKGFGYTDESDYEEVEEEQEKVDVLGKCEDEYDFIDPDPAIFSQFLKGLLTLEEAKRLQKDKEFKEKFGV